MVPIYFQLVGLPSCLHQRDGFLAGARGHPRELVCFVLASGATTSFGHDMLTLTQLRLLMEGNNKVQVNSHFTLVVSVRCGYVGGFRRWRHNMAARFPTCINVKLPHHCLLPHLAPLPACWDIFTSLLILKLYIIVIFFVVFLFICFLNLHYIMFFRGL